MVCQKNEDLLKDEISEVDVCIDLKPDPKIILINFCL